LEVVPDATGALEASECFAAWLTPEVLERHDEQRGFESGRLGRLSQRRHEPGIAAPSPSCFPAFFAVACLIGLMAHSLVPVAITGILISAIVYARLGAGNTPATANQATTRSG
jgi:hypothetical protein